MRLIFSFFAGMLVALPVVLWAGESGINPAIGHMSAVARVTKAPAGKSVLSYDRAERIISLAIPRDQSVTFMAYFVNGERIGEFNRTRFMRKGIYTIKLDMAKLPRGVLIFKASGDDFSESKTIRLIDNIK